ncbi:MAG: gliding motility-associated C-terminal domain-containing protein [Bacteroidales bacterium]
MEKKPVINEQCCNQVEKTKSSYTAKSELPPLENVMEELSPNDSRVKQCIDPQEVWDRKSKPGNFKSGEPDFVSETVEYDDVKYVKIDDKIYYQFFLSPEKLKKKYNPKDLDMSIYKGYLLWEAQVDIEYIADSIQKIKAVDEVEIVSQYYLKVHAPKSYVISNFGDDFLDPDDGEYPGYYPYARLKTAPYLPLISGFPEDLTEDKSYRTPYMRVFNLDDGEKMAIITMRPNAYPLMPKNSTASLDELPSSMRKNLQWIDIPANEPVRNEIADIIKTAQNGIPTKDAMSDPLDMQIYINAIEVDNDGSDPLNWVIEATEGSYYIQLGSMRDDSGLFKNHNYARMADKFDISPIYSSTDVTGVEYQTYIANTDPTCWDSWIGDCDCITDWQEVGPEVKDMDNNLTAGDNLAPGGDKDFNNTTWYDDIEGGTVYYIDPAWNWDKGDGYTNYDVVFNTSGISDFEGRLSDGWYVIGIADKNENNEDPEYWQGVETLNYNSTLRITFIPQCGDTDMGTITPSMCSWQGASYNAGETPYWEFDATAGDYYNFTLCSNSEDSYLRIYDSFNNLVASQDDNGPFCSGLSSSISWSPSSSGTYYITASKYSCVPFTNNGTMYYSKSDGPWNNNGNITPTQSWQTAPVSAGQISFHKFTATAGTAYAFNMCDLSEDTYIRIFDDSWSQVTYNNDNGPCCAGTSASTVWVCSSSGTYRVAVMHFSCNPLSSAGNLNYRISQPEATATASTTEICHGETTTLQGSGTAVCGSVTQYDWDHLSGDNNPQNTIVSPTSDQTYQLRVLDDHGIWSDWVSIDIIVHPLPQPNLGGDQSVCVYNTPVTLDPGSFSSYQWSTSETSSIINVSTSDTYSVTVTDANGCTNSDAMTLTVNSEATPDLGSDQTVCEDETPVTLNPGSFDTYAWSTSEASSTIDVSTTNSYEVTVTDANGCTGSDAMHLTVNPSPFVDLGGNQTHCEYDVPITLDAGGGMSDYSWSTTETTQTINVSSADTYSVTVTNSYGCTASDMMTLTVNSAPTPDLGGDQSVCDYNIPYTLDPGVYNDYLWNTSETTPTIEASNEAVYQVTVTDVNGCSGSDNMTLSIDTAPSPDIGGDQTVCEYDTPLTLDAGVYSDYSWSTSETSQIISVDTENTYSVTVTDANGCTASDAMYLTIPQTPVPDLGQDMVVCEDETPVTLDPGTNPSWDYAWTGGNLNPTLDVNTTGIYSVTVTNNGCTGTDEIDVTINPLPVAPTSATSDINDFCADEPGNINLSVSGGSGDEVHWFTGSCGGIEVGTGNPLSIPSPESDTTFFARWENACGASSCVSIDINVLPLPVMPDFVSADDNNLCPSETGNINLSAAGGSGDDIHWFTGACGDTEIGTGNPLNIPPPDSTTTYYARWENTCGASECDSTTINVFDLPQPPHDTYADQDSVCENNTGNINLSVSGGSGTTVQWFTGGCGTNSIGSGNPLSTPSPTNTTTYYARWENICGVSDCDSTTVYVIPDTEEPTEIVVDTNNLCSADSVMIEFTANGGYGEEVHWFTGNCGDTEIAIGNPVSIVSPDVTTTYYARWQNQCDTSACASLTINITQSADATIDPVTPFCLTDGPTVLTAAETGGTWSGPGVEPATGFFEPDVAGVGAHTIYYTIGDPCGDTDSIIIYVVDNFDATIDPAGPFCSDDDPVTLTAATGGGTWSGPGITDTLAGTFDPSIVTVGVHTIYYEFIASCGDTDNINIEIIEAADATITPAGPFCEFDSPVVLSAAETGGTWSGPGVDPVSGFFEPDVAGTGDHEITYEITGQCGDSDTIIITVNPVFDATIDPAGPFCSDDGPVTLTAADTGGVWSGTGITDSIAGIFDPQTAGEGTHQITYEFSGACGNSDQISITVNPAADATINTAGPFCETDSPVVLTAAEIGGTWSGPGVDSNTGFFEPQVAGIGNHEISYTIAGDCGDTDTITVSVIENFDATIQAAENYCSNDSVTVIDANTDGGTWYLDGTELPDSLLYPQDISTGQHTLVYAYSGLCGDADTLNITVHQSANATIEPAGPFIITEPPVMLSAADDGGTWEGNGVNENTGEFTPEQAGIGEHMIIYTITGICGDTDTTTIEVDPEEIKDLLVPDVITPNGDGSNDTWNIQGIEAFSDVEISIFTRWGDEIYHFKDTGDAYADPSRQWDGTYNDMYLPLGSYVYILILNNNLEFKGTITIIQ